MKGKTKPLQVRRLLIRIYVEKGYHAAKPLAIKYGVNPRYLAEMARNAGAKKKPVFGDQHIHPKSTHNDPRWARAIAVGVVVA